MYIYVIFILLWINSSQIPSPNRIYFVEKLEIVLSCNVTLLCFLPAPCGYQLIQAYVNLLICSRKTYRYTFFFNAVVPVKYSFDEPKNFIQIMVNILIVIHG